MELKKVLSESDTRIDGRFFSDFGGYLYFRGGYNSGNGWELWRTDGTNEGTVLFKDFNPGSDSTSFRGLGIADLPNIYSRHLEIIFILQLENRNIPVVGIFGDPMVLQMEQNRFLIYRIW